jgi:hypothetical protein
LDVVDDVNGMFSGGKEKLNVFEDPWGWCGKIGEHE